ncbi:uncharacterized protein MAM_02309 [Metarhizium album ARSEF 1941]|uniref:Uncharacterized protein n=1 Tax=Metarhizium album (strain ARSEF 1941) TaxID=1081103 RepID=A0A0B2WTQ1_METAS|nr:uncharacterized protein MAM_02309 [Metarhizium album ARSEF 1941]KHN99456.1 hypothetical protein MAM_02309 [Metarhizium album ARSEF 1941]
MIRSAARLSQADPGVAPHLLRTKTFVKKLDKNNEAYYVLAKKGLAHNSDPAKEYEFFEMPNLLLDLDAEGTRHVRPAEDADEKLMMARWTEVPRRKAARTRLKLFEAQLFESRRKAHEIISQPTNIWRITDHDIVSAALHGGSGPQRKPARESKPADIISERINVPKSPSNSEIIKRLLLENGIPGHAANQDQLLLHWMTRRYHSLTRASRNREPPAPSPAQLTRALKTQTTILGVRRLVSQALSAGTSVDSFRSKTKPDLNLPHQIRSTCSRILGQDPLNRNLRLQALTFLGNLSERLPSLGLPLGPVLCGLALKLCSEVGSLEALSRWLHRIHNTSINSELSTEDVVSALTALQSISVDEHDAMLQTVEQRQLLFQLLTGIDENNTIAKDAFRTFFTTFPEEHGSSTARHAYSAYVTLLGNLGAARTLWREWRELPDSVSKDDHVVLGFCNALKQATRLMPASDGEHAPDLGLAVCATLDYHAMEMQDAASWRAHASDDVAGQENVNIEACRSILNLPLADCIKEFRTW